ncbi:hypothetical protein ACQKFC_27560, partial [Raoultella planticola]
MLRHLRYLGLLLPLFTFSSSAAEQNPAVQIAPAGSQNAVYGPALKEAVQLKNDKRYDEACQVLKVAYQSTGVGET